ncbi:MAG: hypothetical protein WCT02_01095 [Candidatus Paceibacterota bacterium]
MRHTLLPLHERIVLRREYYIRALVVLFFTLSLAGLLGIAALFPAFSSASEAVRVSREAVSSLKKSKTDSGLMALQQEMIQSQGVLNSLGSRSEVMKTGDFIGGIIQIKGPLRFSSIAIGQISSTTAMATIHGIAPTRDSLLAFKSRFEGLTPGNKVDLPVSTLSKSTNIEFTFQITQKFQ